MISGVVGRRSRKLPPLRGDRKEFDRETDIEATPCDYEAHPPSHSACMVFPLGDHNHAIISYNHTCTAGVERHYAPLRSRRLGGRGGSATPLCPTCCEEPFSEACLDDLAGQAKARDRHSAHISFRMRRQVLRQHGWPGLCFLGPHLSSEAARPLGSMQLQDIQEPGLGGEHWRWRSPRCLRRTQRTGRLASSRVAGDGEQKPLPSCELAPIGFSALQGLRCQLAREISERVVAHV